MCFDTFNDKLKVSIPIVFIKIYEICIVLF